MDIYGRDGKPITLEEFAAVPRKKRIVKRSTLILGREPIMVLTEWDGKDMSHGEAPMPMPFSTVVLSESYPNMLMAVPDEKRARMSHEMMCGFVRAQGGKGGWRVPAYFLLHVWGNPKTVKLGWFNVILSALVVLFQLQALTATAIMGNWSWANLISVAIVGLYGLWLKNAVQGLRRKLRERREERRVAADKEAFEKIVRQLE